MLDIVSNVNVTDPSMVMGKKKGDILTQKLLICSEIAKYLLKICDFSSLILSSNK